MKFSAWWKKKENEEKKKSDASGRSIWECVRGIRGMRGYRCDGFDLLSWLGFIIMLYQVLVL